MASSFCHVFGGTKRFRLERIVRPIGYQPVTGLFDECIKDQTPAAKKKTSPKSVQMVMSQNKKGEPDL